MIRVQFKRVIEMVLARWGPSRVGRMRVRHQTLILAYHNVLPDDVGPCGERAVHLSLSDFVWQLDELVRYCHVVPLVSAVTGARNRDHTRPCVSITFDDAYCGAVTLAVRALADRRLPATFFVPGGLLGGPAFWWDRVADAMGGELDPSLRQELIEVQKGSAEQIDAWARAQGMKAAALPPACLPATEAELARAVTIGDIKLGAHTWGHPNLTVLDPDALRAELSRPSTWLRARFPEQTIPWLSYPYGLENAAVRRAVREAGYEGAVRVSGGWFVPHSDGRWALPRLNVPSGVSPHGFTMRMAGLIRQ